MKPVDAVIDAYANGTLWQAPYPHCGLAVLQVLPNTKFCLLAFTYRARHGGTCLNVVTDLYGSGKWQYDLEELEERLAMWAFLPGQSLEVVSRGQQDEVGAMVAATMKEMYNETRSF